MSRKIDSDRLVIRFQSRNKDFIGILVSDIIVNNLIVLFVYFENLSKIDFNSNGQICLVEGILKQRNVQIMVWLQFSILIQFQSSRFFQLNIIVQESNFENLFIKIYRYILNVIYRIQILFEVLEKLVVLITVYLCCKYERCRSFWGVVIQFKRIVKVR